MSSNQYTVKVHQWRHAMVFQPNEGKKLIAVRMAVSSVLGQKVEIEQHLTYEQALLFSSEIREAAERLRAEEEAKDVGERA